VKPNFRALGPRVGKRMPALKAALAAADGAALLREFETNGRVTLTVDAEPLELGPDEIAVTLEAREGFAAAAGTAGVVVLHTALSDALIEEGLFREVLNRVQTFRKELDLEYTGRIRLTLDGADRLLSAVRPRADALGRETLAVDVADRRAAARGRARSRGHDRRRVAAPRIGARVIPPKAGSAFGSSRPKNRVGRESEAIPPS
jgi:isoleucyl-tRNA synthetase